MNQRGFTIVELMIATAAFSSVMLIVALGVISFSRQYQKGVVTNRTQGVVRSVTAEITQAIQFGSDVNEVIVDDQKVGYCINNRAYYFVTGRQIGGTTTNGTKHALVTGVTCPAPMDITTKTLAQIEADGLVSPRELLGENMRLLSFDVTESNGANVFDVALKVAYGDDDLLCSTDGSRECEGTTDFQSPTLRCRTGAGNEYCAIFELQTSVVKRL